MTHSAKRSPDRPLAGPLALGGPAAAAPGLSPDKPLSQFTLDSWDTEQGLPQGTVNALVQTRDGYLWAGTYDGLARFDGARFEVFEKTRTPGLLSNGIRALAEDREGTLWVGTNGGGLSRRRGARFEALPESVTGGAIVWAVLPDRDAGIWIGTATGSVVRYRDGHARVERAPSGEAVYALAQDGAGNLWVGTNGHGLQRRAPDGTWREWRIRDGLPSDVVAALRVDRSGDLWVGTVGGGLARFQDGRFTAYGAAQGLPSPNVWALVQDRQGTLWAGTGAGLARLRRGRFDLLTPAAGLPDSIIYSLLEDRQGTLWVGSNLGGLARLREGRFTVHGRLEGLPSDAAYAVVQDREGRFWSGTSGGLARQDGEQWTAITTRDGLCFDAVRGLAVDRAGLLWAATYGGGLCRHDGRRFEAITARDGLAHDSVRTILLGSDGALWAGTVNGLSRLQGGRFTNYGTAQGLPSPSIICLLEDRQGSLWVGTDGGGVARLREGRFEVYGTASGLGSGVVLGLFEDRQGGLWVGTNGGLSRLQGQRFFTYTGAHGLPSEAISQIVQDASGRIWLGTSRGVAAIPLASLDAVAAGRAPRLELELFGRGDGLESVQCTAPAQAFSSRDGRLWFPTRRGLAVIDPETPAPELGAPQVVVEGLEVDDRSVPVEGSGLELPPGSGRIVLRFTAPELLVPGRVRFRYRLEGYDEGWVEAGDRRTAHYTGVGPGHYTFRVMAGLAGGPWRDDGVELPLVLLPRWHQTRAFLAGCASLTVLALTLVHRLRVRRLALREQQLRGLILERTRSLAEEKERAFAAAREADRQKRVAQEAASLKAEFLGIAAHDLKNPLVAVRGFSEILARGGVPAAQVSEMATRIGQAADRMLALIDDLLTTAAAEGSQARLQFHSVDLGVLAGTVLEEMRPLAGRKQQSLRLKVEEGCRAEVDEGRIREVVENLVANAVKYSPAGSSIRVEVARVGSSVRISVADQGPGLTPDDWPRLFLPFVRLSARPTGGETSTGLGLSIVKRLVELHAGRVFAESRGPRAGHHVPRRSPGVRRRLAPRSAGIMLA